MHIQALTQTQRRRYGDPQASILWTHSTTRGLRLEMSKVVGESVAALAVADKMTSASGVVDQPAGT